MDPSRSINSYSVSKNHAKRHSDSDSRLKSYHHKIQFSAPLIHKTYIHLHASLIEGDLHGRERHSGQIYSIHYQTWVQSRFGFGFTKLKLLGPKLWLWLQNFKMSKLLLCVFKEQKLRLRLWLRDQAKLRFRLRNLSPSYLLCRKLFIYGLLVQMFRVCSCGFLDSRPKSKMAATAASMHI